MYLGFGSRRSNDAFSHPHQQQLQHPDIDAMEQFTEDLGEGIEIPPQHRSSGFPLGDGRHPADTARMQHHQHPKLLNSDSISTMPPQPVDIEEFAGDSPPPPPFSHCLFANFFNNSLDTDVLPKD